MAVTPPCRRRSLRSCILVLVLLVLLLLLLLLLVRLLAGPRPGVEASLQPEYKVLAPQFQPGKAPGNRHGGDDLTMEQLDRQLLLSASIADATDERNAGYAPCPLGQFRASPGEACEPALTCDGLAAAVTVGEPLATGGVKRLFRCAGCSFVSTKSLIEAAFTR